VRINARSQTSKATATQFIPNILAIVKVYPYK